MAGVLATHVAPSPGPGKAQTRMRRPEIVNRADQIHPMLQRQGPACQGPPSTRQRRQAFAKGCVEPLDVRGVEHPIALRTAPGRLDAGGRPGDETAFDVDHTPLCIAVEVLRWRGGQIVILLTSDAENQPSILCAEIEQRFRSHSAGEATITTAYELMVRSNFERFQKLW